MVSNTSIKSKKSEQIQLPTSNQLQVKIESNKKL